MKKTLLAGLLMLSACGLSNQGVVVRPESLINSSAEKISFPVSDVKSVGALVDWLNAGDTPTSAEVVCRDGNSSCTKVKKILTQKRVAFLENPTAEDKQSVSLVYARLRASACFLDQLGCATSLNSVRMVANREQFIKPFISDLQDAETAVRAVGIR